MIVYYTISEIDRGLAITIRGLTTINIIIIIIMIIIILIIITYVQT